MIYNFQILGEAKGKNFESIYQECSPYGAKNSKPDQQIKKIQILFATIAASPCSLRYKKVT